MMEQGPRLQKNAPSYSQPPNDPLSAPSPHLWHYSPFTGIVCQVHQKKNLMCTFGVLGIYPNKHTQVEGTLCYVGSFFRGSSLTFKETIRPAEEERKEVVNQWDPGFFCLPFHGNHTSLCPHFSLSLSWLWHNTSTDNQKHTLPLHFHNLHGGSMILVPYSS